MLGVVMLAAAVPTLPAVSYYLPPRKNTLAPVGQPPVAIVLVSPVKNRCVTAHRHHSVGTPREACSSSHTYFLVFFVCFHCCRSLLSQ